MVVLERTFGAGFWHVKDLPTGRRAGLFQDLDGSVWVREPDGAETRLPHGEEEEAVVPDVNYVLLRFEETPGAGTYEATVTLPTGSLITAEAYKTTVAWDADTAEMNVGVTSDLDAIENDVNVKNVYGTGNDPSGGIVPYDADGEAEIVVRVETTGAGGSTGRTTVAVAYTTPVEITATKSS